MCSVKCSAKCVLQSVPQYMFHKVFSKICSTKCVPWNVFCDICSTKCSAKYVLQNVFCEVFCKVFHEVFCEVIPDHHHRRKVHQCQTNTWNRKTESWIKTAFELIGLSIHEPKVILDVCGHILDGTLWKPPATHTRYHPYPLPPLPATTATPYLLQPLPLPTTTPTPPSTCYNPYPYCLPTTTYLLPPLLPTSCHPYPLPPLPATAPTTSLYPLPPPIPYHPQTCYHPLDPSPSPHLLTHCGNVQTEHWPLLCVYSANRLRTIGTIFLSLDQYIRLSVHYLHVSMTLDVCEKLGYIHTEGIRLWLQMQHQFFFDFCVHSMWIVLEKTLIPFLAIIQSQSFSMN